MLPKFEFEMRFDIGSQHRSAGGPSQNTSRIQNKESVAPSCAWLVLQVCCTLPSVVLEYPLVLLVVAFMIFLQLCVREPA